MDWFSWGSAASSAIGTAVSMLVLLFSERVRARVSGDLWVAQERWQLKRTVYEDLLRVLRRLGIHYSDLEYVERYGKERGLSRDAIDVEATRVLTEKVIPALEELAMLIPIGHLWLQRETIDALELLQDSLGLAHASDDEARRTALDHALTSVIAEAQKDLRFNVGPRRKPLAHIGGVDVKALLKRKA